MVARIDVFTTHMHTLVMVKMIFFLIHFQIDSNNDLKYGINGINFPKMNHTGAKFNERFHYMSFPMRLIYCQNYLFWTTLWRFISFWIYYDSKYSEVFPKYKSVNWDWKSSPNFWNFVLVLGLNFVQFMMYFKMSWMKDKRLRLFDAIYKTLSFLNELKLSWSLVLLTFMTL